MKKTSSIIKLIVVGVALAICLVLATCSFRIPGTDYNYNSFASVIDLGLDLKGGVYALYEASSEDTANFSSKLDATKTRLSEMLRNRGYNDSVVVTEGNNRIRVSIPDEDDAQNLFQIIGTPAGIEFVMDSTDDVILTGDDVVSAVGAYGDTGNGASPYVQLILTDAGRSKFSQATANNIGSTMSIYLVYDGVREDSPITTATINAQIDTDTVITMGTGATETDAKNLADQINSGTFQLNLSMIDSGAEAAVLSGTALTISVVTVLIALVIVFVFLAVKYRLIGVSSIITMLIYGVVTIFVFAEFPLIQLSISSIAGILVGIGVAIDGCVIISERIRKEFLSGKSVSASYHAGNKKSISYILFSNIMLLCVAFILALLGPASLLDFGIALIISTVISMLCVFFVFRFISQQFVNLFGVDDGKSGILGLKRPSDTPSVADNADASGVLEEGGAN